MQCICYQYR